MNQTKREPLIATFVLPPAISFAFDLSCRLQKFQLRNVRKLERPEFFRTRPQIHATPLTGAMLSAKSIPMPAHWTDRSLMVAARKDRSLGRTARSEGLIALKDRSLRRTARSALSSRDRRERSPINNYAPQ